MKQINFLKFIPAIAWFFVVLVFDVLHFDKWVHIGIFGLLALLFMLPFARSPIQHKEKLQYFIVIAISTSMWGLTTEFIQKYLVYGRNFDLFDWAADSVGAFTSFFICRKKYI